MVHFFFRFAAAHRLGNHDTLGLGNHDLCWFACLVFMILINILTRLLEYCILVL